MVTGVVFGEKAYMNEHPVPRNVTGFEFQLIGFMTLKQFGYLVAGAILAFVFYNAPISFFRFPIAAFFLFVGLAFAFLPVQERPLDEWIANLIKSVYQPTQFVWEKEVRIPALFEVKTTAANQKRATSPEHHEDTRAKLKAYLASVAPKGEARLDAAESQTLAKVSDLFGQNIPIKQGAMGSVKQAQPSLATIATKLFAHPPAPQAATIRQSHHTTNALPKGLIAGMVKTVSGPLAGAIVHILTENNQPARLLKTNANGQFGISLPLAAGRYRLVIEDISQQHSFAPIVFEIGEQELHPWLIVPIGEKH